MSDQQKQPLSEEELEESNGEPLPDREAMSIIPLPDPIDVIKPPVEPPAES